MIEHGKIVNIDRAGNRVAGMIFGAPRVILVVGRNKIVKNLEEALYRIKNIIAPEHAKRKGMKTPCADSGHCIDCDNPERLCNVTAILEKRPAYTDFSVILINKDLGLGWDPSWRKDRIARIRSNYSHNTWVYRTPESE